MARNVAPSGPSPSRIRAPAARAAATSASAATPEVALLDARGIKQAATGDEILGISFPARENSGDADQTALERWWRICWARLSWQQRN
jgi:hypothetical protein